MMLVIFALIAYTPIDLTRGQACPVKKITALNSVSRPINAMRGAPSHCPRPAQRIPTFSRTKASQPKVWLP